MTVNEKNARMTARKSEKRRQSIISDRRERISESFTEATENSEELKKSFDEWMKIKINATNSWTLALIDYFHDLTLLRDGDSINFQKASCTLDGCVKIYTSRVDSVDVETKKLLNGLQTYGNQVDETIETQEEVGQKTKKREHRHTNTLEKDITNLDLKKFDIEFVVDPLFRKTSADFDEGGATGLLLNHLNISSNGRLIFDAGDISLDSDRAKDQVMDSPWIDFEKLKGHFESKLSKLWESEICWALRNFEFSNPDNQIYADIDFTKEADPSDFYDFSPNFDDQDSNGGNDLPDMGYGDQEMTFHQGNPEAENESFAHYLPVTGIQDGLFSYFDTSVFRNWAGPEHWRSKPLSCKFLFTKVQVKKTEKPKSSKRIPKEVEIIDFLDTTPIDFKKLFSQGNSSINLPKNERQKSNFLLPEDLHISYKDIGKLFSNPEYQITFKSKRQATVRAVSNENMLDGLEKDDLFWANNEMIISNDNENIQVEDNTPQGFEFDPYDDDDEVDFGIQGETPEGAPADVSVFLDYGDQLVEPPKKVFAVPLRYAKTAKRVDVKKLKENIWKEMLDINDQESELPSAGKFETPKKFSELVSGLDNFYPEQKRQDISAAFCFICVLHLANEQNLSIKGSAQLEDLIISQNT